MIPAVGWVDKISIHAPREGSDPLPAAHRSRILHFYPRSPRGERLVCRGRRPLRGIISIHAPREGSDVYRVPPRASASNFYPRSPRGERPFLLPSMSISTSYFYPRSPRGERPWTAGCCRFSSRFLSTLPARGATTGHHVSKTAWADFYPRSPRGERRYGRRFFAVRCVISIHAPREGSDSRWLCMML